MTKVLIKAWFWNKLTNDGGDLESFNRMINYENNGAKIIRETEKAYLLNIEGVRLDGETVYKNVWVPKSCTEVAAVGENTIKAFDDYKAKDEALRASLKRGAKVKKVGGRKIYTVTSDHICYGCVYLDDKYKVDIHNLVVVEEAT